MTPRLGITAELPLKLSLRPDKGSSVLNHANDAGFDVTFGEEQSYREVLQRSAEILEVISVEQRIADRVDVRENDAELHEEVVHLAVRAESHHAVDGVQREPADDEEEDNTREILRGLDLSFARRPENTQHRPRRLMMIAT